MYIFRLSFIEEYIDLIPILKNLYFDTDEFCKQIKEVKVVN